MRDFLNFFKQSLLGLVPFNDYMLSVLRRLVRILNRGLKADFSLRIHVRFINLPIYVVSVDFHAI